jgi:cytochrome c-type biogenesis protein CcmH/NrfF
VLLEPTRRGLNLLPWLFPIVAAAAGAAVWIALVRRSPRRIDEPVSEAERRRIQGELASLEDAP